MIPFIAKVSWSFFESVDYIMKLYIIKDMIF